MMALSVDATVAELKQTVRERFNQEETTVVVLLDMSSFTELNDDEVLEDFTDRCTFTAQFNL